MSQPPKDVVRDEINEAFREALRYDREHPDSSKAHPADVLDYGRRQMARAALVKKWWGLFVLGAIGAGISGSIGEVIKWLSRKLLP